MLISCCYCYLIIMGGGGAGITEYKVGFHVIINLDL